MLTLHASCVARNGLAVLLRGASGSGKSDLAFRMIDAGARLVADDCTRLSRDDTRLIAGAPETIRGLLEIRGLGPVELLPAAPTPLALVIDLVPRTSVPRLPEPRFETFLGIALPCLSLDAFTASAAAVALLALERAAAGRLFEPAEARGLRRRGAAQ
ncbi:HPr kinase/phosphatase C-terminal domain-containing protein [Ferrovibrio sp.]|uniref:HPr kinase/phosphorylase n=1 Tax=Ferrovibrio sp. TaxID=1917215 RepID=UPI00311F5865